MKYTSKYSVSRFTKIVKNSILSWYKGDVPYFIIKDIENRINKGERVITISMIGDRNSTKSITDYLNEYHNERKYWNIDFLQKAFELLSNRIESNFFLYSDVKVEILDLSFTDKRITIYINTKE